MLSQTCIPWGYLSKQLLNNNGYEIVSASHTGFAMVFVGHVFRTKPKQSMENVQYTLIFNEVMFGVVRSLKIFQKYSRIQRNITCNFGCSMTYYKTRWEVGLNSTLHNKPDFSFHNSPKIAKNQIIPTFFTTGNLSSVTSITVQTLILSQDTS